VQIIAFKTLFLNSSGNKISASNLIYTWKQNGTVLGDLSGYGRSTLNFTGPLLPRATIIEVDVATTDNTLLASGGVSLRSGAPEILFYENNPLYGMMYNKVIGNNYNLEGQEISLTAEPFYFSGKSSQNYDLTYNWKLNNNEVFTETVNSLTLRNEADQSGTANLALEITSRGKIYQTARRALSLNFGEATISNESLFNQ